MANCGHQGELQRLRESFNDVDDKISKVKKVVYQLKTSTEEQIYDENQKNKTYFNKKISDLQSAIKMDLKTEIDVIKKSQGTNDAALSTLLVKFNTLEEELKEKMRRMDVAQDIKMAEVDGKLGGVTEIISTAVDSVLELKGKDVTSSADDVVLDELCRLKKETEAIWVQLRNIEISGTEIEASATSLVKKKEPLAFRPQLMMNSFNLVTQSHRFYESYNWNLDGFKTVLAQKTFELFSKKFQWTKYPVEARAKLRLKEDDSVYVSMCLEHALKSPQKDLVVPLPRVFYLLKFMKNIKCSQMSYLFDTEFNCSLQFEACLGHKSSFIDGPELNAWNGFVQLEIYVEPPLMAQHVHSYDGTLEWKIEHYERRLQLGNGRLAFYQENPYFYTSPCGYRVQVEIFLNEGEGLTAHIAFLTGKFDAELPKSFPHSTTVTLINPKDPERSIGKTVVEDIASEREYVLEICKVKEAKNLVENHTLFCKVVIEAQQQNN